MQITARLCEIRLLSIIKSVRQVKHFQCIPQKSAQEFCNGRRPAAIKRTEQHILFTVKYLLFTGGGSAGHVVPNLAVMQELQTRFRMAYMGTDGIERELATGAGYPFYSVSCPKLRRALTLQNLTFPVRLRRAQRAALEVLRRDPPDLVFSKGGYASYPAVWAAYRLHIPVLTHESDLTPGLCTRLIAKKCRRVLTSFPETAARFDNGLYVGSPIRRELFAGDRLRTRQAYGFCDDRPVLLVLGGGSGSRVINEAVRDALRELLPRFCILHLCGKNNLCSRTPAGYVQREYEPNMQNAYACADLVLSRAGSNTVFEILALKKPALLIPLSRATRGDQKQNARYFWEKGLCEVLDERRIKELPAALLRLYGNAAVRSALAAAPVQSGTGRIAQIISETVYPAQPQMHRRTDLPGNSCRGPLPPTRFRR